MIAYHVTTKENYKKIISQGLIPQIGDRSIDLGEDKEAIYLFPNLGSAENALMNWMGEWFEDQEIELVLLEVNLQGIKFNPGDKTMFEIIVNEIISPDRITYLKDC